MESTDGVVPAPGPTNELTVLHVEDDPAFAELTRIHLERAREAMTVVTETDPAAAIEYLEANGTVDAPVDCIVSDYQMPGMDGLELLRAVREKFPSLPFVLFTGQGSEEVAADAFAADATDYLRKDSGSGATSSSNTASPTRGTVRGSASPSSAPSSRPTGGPSP